MTVFLLYFFNSFEGSVYSRGYVYWFLWYYTRLSLFERLRLLETLDYSLKILGSLFNENWTLFNFFTKLLFNAAQPGVGRVHVLGSKKLLLLWQLFNQNLVLESTGTSVQESPVQSYQCQGSPDQGSQDHLATRPGGVPRPRGGGCPQTRGP